MVFPAADQLSRVRRSTNATAAPPAIGVRSDSTRLSVVRCSTARWRRRAARACLSELSILVGYHKVSFRRNRKCQKDLMFFGDAPEMKATIFRIADSLGILIPKSLRVWATPGAQASLAQDLLDERKRLLAVALVREFSPRQIPAQSLANLRRWKNRAPRFQRNSTLNCWFGCWRSHVYCNPVLPILQGCNQIGWVNRS